MDYSEVILLDKPTGVSSRGAIELLRDELKLSKKVKMGHAGTLDPRATGLLVVGIGAGTKRLKEFVGLPKEYEAEILLGIKTDTGDLDGAVVEECAVERVEKSRVKKVLGELLGKQMLPVPKFSATKVRGKPMYALARRGERVPVAKREMEILSAKLLDSHAAENSHWTLNVQFKVSSGTYIRSLAEEVGRRLGGLPATLAGLRRTRVGDFRVEDSFVQQSTQP